MTSFILKIIGIITMFCDHCGDSLIGHFSFLNLIGRIAFPIFAFQIVQGYIHTSNIKKYMLRLLLFACISQIPFILFLSTFTNSYYLNIFFTLLLGIVALYGYNTIKNSYLRISFVALTFIVAHFIQVDYGAYGIIVIFLFYIFSIKFNNKIFMCLTFVVITILNYLPNIVNYPIIANTYINCIIFTCISLIPICAYNGKQGLNVKYLFYIFYPIHLFILWILNF